MRSLISIIARFNNSQSENRIFPLPRIPRKLLRRVVTCALNVSRPSRNLIRLPLSNSPLGFVGHPRHVFLRRVISHRAKYSKRDWTYHEKNPIRWRRQRTAPIRVLTCPLRRRRARILVGCSLSFFLLPAYAREHTRKLEIPSMSGKLGRSKLRSCAEKAKSRLHCRFEWPVVEGITSFNPIPPLPLRFRAPASPLFCQLKPQTGRLPRVISWRRIVTAIRKFRELSARVRTATDSLFRLKFHGPLMLRSLSCPLVNAGPFTRIRASGDLAQVSHGDFCFACTRNNGCYPEEIVGDARACNLMLITWKIVCIRDNGCYPLCKIVYDVAIPRCCHLSKN